MTVKIGDNLYGEKIFYRVKVDVAKGGTKVFWAQKRWERKDGGIGYRKCNRFGQTRWKETAKADVELIELVLVQKEDIIYEKQARMNLHYAELEIIKEEK